MEWKPKAGILADTAESEPTKTSKPVFVGFDGSYYSGSREICPDAEIAERARAVALLNRAGVRMMAFEGGGAMIGVWSDLDGIEVRTALRALGSDRLPIRYLDGAGIHERYKVRRAEGEAVPVNVLKEMEQHAAEPWKVRDRLLNEMGWCSKGRIPKHLRLVIDTETRKYELAGANR